MEECRVCQWLQTLYDKGELWLDGYFLYLFGFFTTVCFAVIEAEWVLLLTAPVIAFLAAIPLGLILFSLFMILAAGIFSCLLCCYIKHMLFNKMTK
ncbi:hypothetical protein [Pseudoalteromonas sp. OOF1S-7]|uniref:hypothetical protein n=1 Tax=Pseudoalteromonas sp. OOF1S-7 TaxID=2917757 RepID=UPI001EF44532|nr:hypothetical protein [Pseudoalteromonas sp. OOF1S-7]MCG7536625.1 hypothetical protein [Pseudoalteromonas sp. OOF1S-7]